MNDEMGPEHGSSGTGPVPARISLVRTPTDWNSILLPSAPVLELVVRGSLTYLTLVLLLRLVGRREAGGLGMTDLLVVVLVADAAGAGMPTRTTRLPTA